MAVTSLIPSLSSNLYGVGGKELASHSTALSTDNQWHHIVSTYDGGTRKIFLDGTEVSSASASGSVASTTAALLLGAADLDSSTNTISACKCNTSGYKTRRGSFLQQWISHHLRYLLCTILVRETWETSENFPPCQLRLMVLPGLRYPLLSRPLFPTLITRLST